MDAPAQESVGCCPENIGMQRGMQTSPQRPWTILGLWIQSCAVTRGLCTSFVVWFSIPVQADSGFTVSVKKLPVLRREEEGRISGLTLSPEL